MTKEEFLKAIESVPKTDSINPISAYNSINVEDLANAVDRFKKVPTYDELLKKNQKYKEVIDKAIEYIDKHKENEYRNGRNDEIYLELNEKELKEFLEILKGE